LPLIVPFRRKRHAGGSVAGRPVTATPASRPSSSRASHTRERGDLLDGDDRAFSDLHARIMALAGTERSQWPCALSFLRVSHLDAT
jgi:hypothetical protein